MAMIAKTKSKTQDYPILKPLRLNGRWYPLEEKTISLSLAQAQFLLLSGKVGKPGTKPAIETQTQKEAK
ncbi:hypothetical protein [Vibrio sp. Isolate24]|uniref:hypothetical protein n=1 Tax=Vibrio sp. Isolate24 TaxID=2908534 RepID=UPI001EFE1AD4|nr:hypothetical protein [Vibrio sp. Isolate24]MCG9678753.1 hypothetical protein [Vibrio sp. Isolate24]